MGVGRKFAELFLAGAWIRISQLRTCSASCWTSPSERYAQAARGFCSEASDGNVYNVLRGLKDFTA